MKTGRFVCPVLLAFSMILLIGSVSVADNCGNWCRERRVFYYCPNANGTGLYSFDPICELCINNNACCTVEAGSPLSCIITGETLGGNIENVTASCDCTGRTWVEGTASVTPYDQQFR